MFYLVVGEEETGDELTNVLTQMYEDERVLQMAAVVWLVYDERATTAKDVWEKLFDDDYDDPPICLVIPFNNYHGVHYTFVWDWKKARTRKGD